MCGKAEANPTPIKARACFGFVFDNPAVYAVRRAGFAYDSGETAEKTAAINT
jgi:hypothetical protein